MNQIGTSKLSTCETHHVTATTGGESATIKTVVANGAATQVPTLAVELVNYGSAVANFNFDGGAAAATDRVIQAGERLLFFVAAETVNVYCATSSTLEINFWS